MIVGILWTWVAEISTPPLTYISKSQKDGNAIRGMPKHAYPNMVQRER